MYILTYFILLYSQFYSKLILEFKANSYSFGATFASDHALAITPFVQNKQEKTAFVVGTTWLERIVKEVDSFIKLTLKRSLSDALPAPTSEKDPFHINHLWLSSPLFSGGKMFTKTERPELLKLLTDAPHGVGDGEILVSLMKKYVSHDQGEKSKQSYIMHAICAALLWHGNLLEEANKLVSNVKSGIPAVPSL